MSQVDRLTIGVSTKSRYLSSEDLVKGSSFLTGLGLEKGSVVWVERRGVEPEVSRTLLSFSRSDRSNFAPRPFRHFREEPPTLDVPVSL